MKNITNNQNNLNNNSVKIKTDVTKYLGSYNPPKKEPQNNNNK